MHKMGCNVNSSKVYKMKFKYSKVSKERANRPLRRFVPTSPVERASSDLILSNASLLNQDKSLIISQ